MLKSIIRPTVPILCPRSLPIIGSWEPETLAYLKVADPLTTEQIRAIDKNIWLIKHNSGITLASVTAKLSLAAPRLVTNVSVDLRPYAMISGVQFSVSDGTKTAIYTGASYGTGETLDPTDIGTDFTNWTGAIPTGWIQSGTPDASNYTEQEPAGNMHIVSDGTAIGIYKTTSTIGVLYKDTIDISAIIGALNINAGTTVNTFTTTGSKTAYTTQTGNTYTMMIRGPGGVNVTCDNWVRKAVTAADATGFNATGCMDAGINAGASSFTVTITKP